MFESPRKKIQVLSTDEDCPICGASGTGCAGEKDYEGGLRIFPPHRKDDPLATFVVQERVFEEVTIGKRKVRKLLYGKGARIRPEEAKRLGLYPGQGGEIVS